MKILSAPQIREADAYTIKNEPIASIDLMERASKACFSWIKKRIRKGQQVSIFCGMGNNGGDGIAIARMLHLSGYDVVVYKVMHSNKSSDDFRINEERFKKLKKAKITEIKSIKDIPDSHGNVFIDALLGSGLNSPLKGLLAEVVNYINSKKAFVISIDIPTGLFCDDNSHNKHEAIINASYTLTFQLPKLSFLFPENEKYVGIWEVLDIGLDQDFINSQDSSFFYLQPEMIKPLYKARKLFSHKGNYGHALLIAGSKGKAGAAVLSARAAIKSGAGLLTLSIPGSCYTPIQSAVP